MKTCYLIACCLRAGRLWRMLSSPKFEVFHERMMRLLFTASISPSTHTTSASATITSATITVAAFAAHTIMVQEERMPLQSWLLIYKYVVCFCYCNRYHDHNHLHSNCRLQQKSNQTPVDYRKQSMSLLAPA